MYYYLLYLYFYLHQEHQEPVEEEPVAETLVSGHPGRPRSVKRGGLLSNHNLASVRGGRWKVVDMRDQVLKISISISFFTLTFYFTENIK